MKATVVTLDPITLVPDQDIQESVGDAISGRLRVQWLDYTWDFDVTQLIDEHGQNARLVFLDTEAGEKALRMDYERPDGVTVRLEPIDASA